MKSRTGADNRQTQTRKKTLTQPTLLPIPRGEAHLGLVQFYNFLLFTATYRKARRLPPPTPTPHARPPPTPRRRAHAACAESETKEEPQGSSQQQQQQQQDYSAVRFALCLAARTPVPRVFFPRFFASLICLRDFSSFSPNPLRINMYLGSYFFADSRLS